MPYGGYDEITFEEFAKAIPVPSLGKELAENHVLLEDVYDAVKSGKKKLLLPQDVSTNKLSVLASSVPLIRYCRLV